jgi:GH25 family lysozyme M1 (1,4-beta-N-acetylmuramidase)
VTGTTSFFVDCSSYQGVPSWARVTATCIGGAEKVTEGTGYVNPDWNASKAGLRQVAIAGFVPVAYMFLDAGASGGAQAQYFASEAGDLGGFGIAVDLERSSGSPTIQQAQDSVAELRKLYPGHPIGGYAPHWYTGNADLSFFDWLWASEYVSGSGDPGVLYQQVPASWWAPYGGKALLMLQFTDSATIAGISGPVDCSAFPGTNIQLASHVLPSPPAPKPPPAPTPEPAVAEPGMIVPLHAGDLAVIIPVASMLPSADFRIIVSGDTGSVVTATAWFTDGGTAQQVSYPLHNGQASSVVCREPWPGVSTVKLQRSDTKTALTASAVVRF